MGEDESKDNSQTEAATDETTRLADRKSVLKLLSLDQWEGVMLTMTRRKTVKNRQLGVCGDMRACHHLFFSPEVVKISCWIKGFSPPESWRYPWRPLFLKEKMSFRDQLGDLVIRYHIMI